MALYRVSLKTHGRLKRGRKASAAQHAAYIVRDRQTPETKAYVEYVLRQSRTSLDREDLAFAKGYNLPAFARDNPVGFFLAAERYEGANRMVSRSLEVALPRELSRPAQQALMEDYCTALFGTRHAYVVGLHDSIGASGEPNPHFHVTWSERIVDGVERPASEYFRRPPHGAGKDDIFRESAWLKATRQAWADLANMALDKAGIEGAYVDARSLKHRGIDRTPEARVSAKVTNPSKLGQGHTEEWQKVLDARKQREAFRAFEQAIAADAWQVRKAELGITDIAALDRGAFVAQIAQQTREAAYQKPQRRSLADLVAEEAILAQELVQLTTLLRATEQALLRDERLAQRRQGRPLSLPRVRGPDVQRGYDPSGRIFDRGQGR